MVELSPMPTPEHHNQAIIEYYKKFKESYRRWGQHPNKPEIYALHFGFNEKEDGSNHTEAVRTTGIELINEGQITNGNFILDAGCGTGSITFELSSRFPMSRICGINISSDQLAAARRHKKLSGAENVSFSLQDYLTLGFGDCTFDEVLFCESLCHASDKTILLRETARVLKPGGKIVIADALTFNNNFTDEEEQLLEQFKRGWLIPNIDSLRTFTPKMIEAGFGNISIKDVTSAVATSMRLSGDYEQMRLLQDPDVDIQRRRGRLGSIATHDLIMNHTIGYFFITASKM